MNFTEFDIKIRKLVIEKKLEEAILLLENERANYQNNLYDITYWLLKLYTIKKDYKKSLSILKFGLENDLWYDFNPNFLNFLSPLNQFDDFSKLIEINSLKKEEEISKSECFYKLVIPKGLQQNKKYPLIIILHGYGQNIDIIEKYWFLNENRSKIFLAFIQSSQLVVPSGYGWDNTELAFDEINSKFNEIADNNPIDRKNVILAGFSQGGNIAIDLSITNKIPNIGFVALCPGNGKPENFEENVEKMGNTNRKGVLITGDQDTNLLSQKEMSKTFKKNNFTHNLIINPEMSHWHPDDFYIQLEKAISYLGV